MCAWFYDFYLGLGNRKPLPERHILENQIEIENEHATLVIKPTLIQVSLGKFGMRGGAYKKRVVCIRYVDFPKYSEASITKTPFTVVCVAAATMCPCHRSEK